MLKKQKKCPPLSKLFDELEDFQEDPEAYTSLLPSLGIKRHHSNHQHLLSLLRHVNTDDNELVLDPGVPVVSNFNFNLSGLPRPKKMAQTPAPKRLVTERSVLECLSFLREQEPHYSNKELSPSQQAYLALLSTIEEHIRKDVAAGKVGKNSKFIAAYQKYCVNKRGYLLGVARSPARSSKKYQMSNPPSVTQITRAFQANTRRIEEKEKQENRLSDPKFLAEFLAAEHEKSPPAEQKQRRRQRVRYAPPVFSDEGKAEQENFPTGAEISFDAMLAKQATKTGYDPFDSSDEDETNNKPVARTCPSAPRRLKRKTREPHPPTAEELTAFQRAIPAASPAQETEITDSAEEVLASTSLIIVR